MLKFWFIQSLVVLYFEYAKSGTYFERAKVPKFTMEGDSREQFLLHWQAQAVSNLMAAKATQLQKYLNVKQQKQFETCCQKSEDFHTYVECFKPVWRKGQLLRRKVKRRRKHKRSSNYDEDFLVAQRQAETVMLIQRDQEIQQQQQFQMQQQMQLQQQQQLQLKLQQEQALATQRSPIGQVADWLTGLVQTIKEPKVIQNGKFQRPSDKPKEKVKTKFENPLEGTLLGNYIDELFKPIQGLSEQLKGKLSTTEDSVGSRQKRFDFKHAVNNYIEETSCSQEVQQELPSWQYDLVKDAHGMFTEMSNVSEAETNTYLFSPRLFPLTPQEPGQRFLSPDILTLNENNQDALGSVPQLFSGLGKGDKDAWMKLIMEASGVIDVAKQFGGYEQLLQLDAQKAQQEQQQQLPVDVNEMFGENFDSYQNSVKSLYSSINAEQIDRMTNIGYAFLSPKQLDVIYGHDKVFGNATFNTTLYATLSDAEREHALLEYFVWLSNSVGSNGTRSKRALILTPLVFSGAAILNPMVLMPIILSPLVFSPVILSPVVLGPIILSPLVFSPVILSPLLLSPIILSPLLFDPVILSPLIFDPPILSPVLGTPFILSPALFSPFILSPLVLGGIILSPLLGDAVILSPLLLFPIVLSPIVLNPFILSPFALVPIILSPIVLSPAILDPHVLSPIILSPILLTPLIMSPGVLSPLINSPIARSLRFLSPELLSPNIESPKKYYASIASPSILSRRKRKNNFVDDKSSSIRLKFPDSFLYRV